MQPVLQVADNVLYVAQQTYDFCLDDTERKK